MRTQSVSPSTALILTLTSAAIDPCIAKRKARAVVRSTSVVKLVHSRSRAKKASLSTTPKCQLQRTNQLMPVVPNGTFANIAAALCGCSATHGQTGPPFVNVIDSELPRPPEHTHLLLSSKESWVEVQGGPGTFALNSIRKNPLPNGTNGWVYRVKALGWIGIDRFKRCTSFSPGYVRPDLFHARGHGATG